MQVAEICRERVPDFRDSGRKSTKFSGLKRSSMSDKESIIRRRTEGAGGFIERKGTGKVGREGVVKEAESKNSEFELNAERYRKPVKLLKKWRDVVAFAFFHDETDSVVLDPLKTSKLLRGNARER